MTEVIKILNNIITNVLTALYRPCGFSLLLSFFSMFFYLYAYRPINVGKGWKAAIIVWHDTFKESALFRKLFLLCFVTSLILFKTLLNRDLWMNPLSNVMGGWSIWETVNGKKKLTTECIENVIMMMPFSATLIWTFGERQRMIWKGIKITFCLSVSIATVYKGNIIKNLIMDCQSYTKYRPNETTGGIFVSWRRKEELPTGA